MCETGPGADRPAGAKSTWQPKPAPSWRSRLLHVGIGAAAPPVGAALAGYAGAAWATVGVLTLGCLWEIATPWLARRLGWAWLHGDLTELAAYAIGAGLGAIAAVMLWGVWR